MKNIEQKIKQEIFKVRCHKAIIYCIFRYMYTGNMYWKKLETSIRENKLDNL